MVEPTLLFEMERHCNNYFNPNNRPDNLIRNYPDSFLALAERINAYINTVEKSNVESIRVGDTSVSFSSNPDVSSWQRAFAKELSIYKRAKFI